MKVLKNECSLLRRISKVIIGSVLIIGGIFLEFKSEMMPVSRIHIYSSLGLLFIFFGTILLVDGVLFYLEKRP